MGLFGKSRKTTEHRYTEERLSAYLDGELASRERDRVERHLATCGGCRWELDTLRKTIQWTMELPTVPVPRVFTIPVAAQPARVARRAWGLPLLQGATAMVAVLFFLALAGEALFPRFLPASAPHRTMGASSEAVPQPTQAAIMAEPPVVEATVVVEQAMQALDNSAPAPADANSTQTVAESVGAATYPAPESTQAAAAQPPSGMGAGEETSTEVPTLRVSVAGTETPTTQAKVAISAMLSETATLELTPTALPTETATLEPSPTPEPTDAAAMQAFSETPSVPTGLPEPSATPLPGPALGATEPTAIAERQALVPAPAADDAGARLPERQNPDLGWLNDLVLALGVAFVLLGTLTVVLMLRRLRTS